MTSSNEQRHPNAFPSPAIYNNTRILARIPLTNNCQLLKPADKSHANKVSGRHEKMLSQWPPTRKRHKNGREKKKCTVNNLLKVHIHTRNSLKKEQSDFLQ